MQCPNCGAENPEISACHTYLIEYSTEQEQWIKNIGDVTYTCCNCAEEIGGDELDIILRQVDEL